MLFTFSKNKHILTKKRNINYSTLLCCHRTIAPHRFCYLISEHGIKYVKNILCFIVSHCVKSQIIIHLSYCLYIIHIDMCKSSCLTTYLSMFKYKYFYTVDPSPLKKTTINMQNCHFQFHFFVVAKSDLCRLKIQSFKYELML